MKIMEVVRDETGDQRMVNEQIVRRPIAQEQGERVKIIIERTWHGRSNEMQARM
jgi:hypothetical protein